jgi:hypothetical protein
MQFRKLKFNLTIYKENKREIITELKDIYEVLLNVLRSSYFPTSFTIRLFNSTFAVWWRFSFRQLCALEIPTLMQVPQPCTLTGFRAIFCSGILHPLFYRFKDHWCFRVLWFFALTEWWKSVQFYGELCWREAGGGQGRDVWPFIKAHPSPNGRVVLYNTTADTVKETYKQGNYSSCRV